MRGSATHRVCSSASRLMRPRAADAPGPQVEDCLDPYATATLDAWNTSAGIGWCSRQVIAIGFSPSCET